MNHEQFEIFVHDVMDSLPGWVHDALDNIEVLVADVPSLEQDPEGAGLLGLYEGLHLPERGIDYAGWLVTRLNRLVSPLLVLLFAWALLAFVLHFSGVSGDVLRLASRASLIPIWFLAIYIMVVALAPATYRAWRRWGFASFWPFVFLALLVDFLFFSANQRWLGWTNYFWVWLGVHHLGYAWRDGRMGSPGRLLAYAGLAIAALSLLIFVGPYPFAMVGSPDEDLSNTLPPKATLIALGIAQFGLLLAIESPMRRRLASLKLWTATVLINSMIMTLYLWHLTVMVILVSLAFLAGGFGLGIEPAGTTWWLTRPVWIGVLFACLLPVALALGPLERRSLPAGASVPSAFQLVTGAVLVCIGVALLALFGFGSAPLPYLDIAAFVAVVIGAGLSGLLPSRRNDS